MPKRRLEQPLLYNQLLEIHGIVFEELDWTPTCVPDPEPLQPYALPIVDGGLKDEDYVSSMVTTWYGADCYRERHSATVAKALITGDVTDDFIFAARTLKETPEEVTSVIPRIVGDLPSADRPQF